MTVFPQNVIRFECSEWIFHRWNNWNRARRKSYRAMRRRVKGGSELMLPSVTERCVTHHWLCGPLYMNGTARLADNSGKSFKFINHWTDPVLIRRKCRNHQSGSSSSFLIPMPDPIKVHPEKARKRLPIDEMFTQASLNFFLFFSVLRMKIELLSRVDPRLELPIVLRFVSKLKSGQE